MDEAAPYRGYIALPTVYRNGKRPNRKGAPYTIFAFDHVVSRRSNYGIAPVYRVVNYSDGSLQLDVLEEGTRDFNRAMKWGGLEAVVFKKGRRKTFTRHHRVFCMPGASANVTREEVVEMFRRGQVRFPPKVEEKSNGFFAFLLPLIQ